MKLLNKIGLKIKNSGQFPNFLTWVRIGLAPIPVILIIVGHDNTTLRLWSVVAFVIIVITDKLDGYVARKWEQITDLGQIIDPIADKVLIVPLFIALCWTEILASPWGWWFLAYNIVREVTVPVVRKLQNKGVVPADEDGKRKMVLQSMGIGLALVPWSYWLWPIVIWLPLVLSLPYSLRSGWHYIQAK